MMGSAGVYRAAARGGGAEGVIGQDYPLICEVNLKPQLPAVP